MTQRAPQPAQGTPSPNCIFAGTGHRPSKLGGYGLQAQQRLVGFAHMVLSGVAPDLVISGMAQGWDQALARAAIELGIPFIAAVPFEDQASRWPLQAWMEYDRLLQQAERVEIICPGGYSPQSMQRRNEWMVDQCSILAVLWDGSAGGTANCVRYARAQGKPMLSLWPDWQNWGGKPKATPEASP